MNSSIANLIRTLVEGLPVADKVAGLVRAIPYNTVVNGKTVVKTIPLSCDVTDPTACNDLEIQDLVPDGTKRSIIYFEDLGWTKLKFPESMGRYYASKLRMVVWMNTKLIGEQCGTSDEVQQDMLNAIEIDRYNSDPFQAVGHKIVSIPPVSNSIFSRYTYNEAERQFLTWPYSYFAMDIETKFILPVGCSIPVDPVPVDCNNPPPITRRRYPSEFTCEELLDPTHGLTEEQLGPDCLDCAGEANCPMTITVQLDGVDVQTVGPIDPCEANTLTITLN